MCLRGPGNPKAHLQHPVIISLDLRVVPFENRVTAYNIRGVSPVLRDYGLWMRGETHSFRLRGLLLRFSHVHASFNESVAK